MSLKVMTFSCRRCLSSLSSLYVRLARTGVEKGFIIFLTATGCWVNWSLAELPWQSVLVVFFQLEAVCLPNQTKGSHPHRLKVGIPRGNFEASSELAGSSSVYVDGLRRPKDLGANEFGHLVGLSGCWSLVEVLREVVRMMIPLMTSGRVRCITKSACLASGGRS
jgi:hypothetical protein